MLQYSNIPNLLLQAACHEKTRRQTTEDGGQKTALRQAQGKKTEVRASEIRELKKDYHENKKEKIHHPLL